MAVGCYSWTSPPLGPFVKVAVDILFLVQFEDGILRSSKVFFIKTFGPPLYARFSDGNTGSPVDAEWALA